MRKPQNIIVCGIPGTGKSTFARNLIDKKVDQGQRALIITDQDDDFEDIEKISLESNELLLFEGMRKSAIFSYDDFKYLDRYYNGLLVMDDVGMYTDPKVPKPVHRTLISVRHRGVDILTVAHALDDMPKALFRFANYLVLFESNVPARQRKDVLRKWKEIEAIQDEISAEFKKGNKNYYRIINLQG